MEKQGYRKLQIIVGSYFYDDFRRSVNVKTRRTIYIVDKLKKIELPVFLMKGVIVWRRK